MAKIKIGQINGRNIFIGNPAEIRNGEYFISMNGNIPSGLYVKQGNDLAPVCECKQQEPNLEEIEILNNYHGKKETVTASEGFDGIKKVTYRKRRLVDVISQIRGILPEGWGTNG